MMRQARMRDYSLDLIKGLACILMIIAHAAGIDGSPLTPILAGENNRLIHLIYMLGEAAPLVFFSVAGVTAHMQAQKYPPRPVMISYAFLFLLGFSYNGITQRDFYDNFLIEMIQIIAIGAFLVYIIEYTKKPRPVTYLVIAIAIFAVKLLSDHAVWLGQLLAFKPGLLLPPGGFPLLPWLFLFFLGAFAYNAKNVYNLILAVVTIVLLAILKLFSFPLQPGNKWDMSLGYFLLSCLMLFCMYYAIRRFDFLRSKNGKQLLIFLGQFSLLFLFIHKFVIRVVHNVAKYPRPYLLLSKPIIFWLVVLVITIIIMKYALRLSSVDLISKCFENMWAWFSLLFLILLVPIIFDNLTVIYSLELCLGIVFAVYYPLLRKVVKQPETLTVSMMASRRSN